MTLAIGARVGPHEITSAIGAGGRGEVYRARDPSIAAHIAHIHGLEDSGSLRALVLELVDGETPADSVSAIAEDRWR